MSKLWSQNLHPQRTSGITASCQLFQGGEPKKLPTLTKRNPRLTGSILSDMAHTQHPYDHLIPLFKMKVDKTSRMHCVALAVTQMKVSCS